MRLVRVAIVAVSLAVIAAGFSSGAVAERHASPQAAHTGEGGAVLTSGLNEVDKASLICDGVEPCRIVITAMVSVVANQSNYEYWKICAQVDERDAPSCAGMMPVFGENPMAGTAILVLKTPRPGRNYHAHVFVQVDGSASTLGKWSVLYQQI